MKNFFLPFCIIFFLTACEKSPTPPPSPGEDTTLVDYSPYPGTYDGIVNVKISGVDSNGVHKSDSSYAYSVKIEYAGEDKITISGQTNLQPIVVDDSGHFEFHDFNRDIEGDFNGDSLYIFSEAISGTYNFPQFYLSEQINFAGEKRK